MIGYGEDAKTKDELEVHLHHYRRLDARLGFAYAAARFGWQHPVPANGWIALIVLPRAIARLTC